MDATPTPPETPGAAPATEPASIGYSSGPAAASPAPPAYSPYPYWGYAPSPWPYPWLVAQRPRPDPATVYKPGVWFYLIALAVVAFGLYDSSLPGGVGVGPAVWLAGALMAFIWILAFSMAAGDSRLSVGSKTWARWVGIPVAGVLFVALVSANVPTSLRFQMSRSGLDAAAGNARDGNVPSAGWIGLFPIDEVHVGGDGAVTFRVAGPARCGFINLEGAARSWDRAGDDGYVMNQLSSTWWTWCQQYNGD